MRQVRALVICGEDDVELPLMTEVLQKYNYEIVLCGSTEAAITRLGVGESSSSQISQILRNTKISQLDSSTKRAYNVGKINQLPDFFDLVITKLGRDNVPINGNLLLNYLWSHVFVIIWSHTAMQDPLMRWKLATNGANMVSADMNAIEDVVKKIHRIKLMPMTGNDAFGNTLCRPCTEGNATPLGMAATNMPDTPQQVYECPFCGMEDLTEDGLWLHCPLYHLNMNPERVLLGQQCPICRVPQQNMQVHIRNAHGPCRRGLVSSEFNEKEVKINAFALVVCIHQGRILLVQEFASTGYWLPGGRVDAGEDMKEAAKRECEEEAGVKIEIDGVLQFQFRPTRQDQCRLRVIFYAKPASEDDMAPKTIPDYESAGAVWCPIDSMEKLPYRGSEPLYWADYIKKGGTIYPIDILSKKER